MYAFMGIHTSSFAYTVYIRTRYIVPGFLGKYMFSLIVSGAHVIHSAAI